MMSRSFLYLGRIWLHGLRQVVKRAVEVHRLWGVGLVLVWAVILAPLGIGRWLSHDDVLDVNHLPLWVSYVLLAGYYLAVAPVLLAFNVPPTAAESAESNLVAPLRVRLDALEAELDRVAAKIGINWGDHWMAQVEALRQAGDLEKAGKVYRELAGVTWDQAHDAIRDWGKNAPERKVRAILLSLNQPRAVGAGADFAQVRSCEK
jgi:hypothetical protein